MYVRVEICGVNTSNLKVLTEKEKTALLSRVKEGDTAAREALISGNLRLVLSIVQRFSGRGESPDDLFQVGCVGLIKAIDNFDMSQNVRFSTYAVPMIIGEIRRYLRDNTAVRISRSMRDTAYKALQMRETLCSRLQREPRMEEIAAELQLPQEEIVMALDAISEPVSLYDPVYSDDGDTTCIMDQIGAAETESDWLEEICMKDAVKSLDERERTILYLRYIRGLTQMEVSGKIGISQAQVSRLEKGAIEHIKERM